jgi:EpsI family protein
VLGEWRGTQATVLEVEILNVLKVIDYVMRRYTDPAGRNLWLYVGYWASQPRGAQSHSPKNCLPGGGWEPLEASQLTIRLPGASPAITVNRYLIQKDRAMQVVLYWYQQQGAAIAGEVPARIAMVRSALVRHRTDGALVRVSMPVSGNVDETMTQLVQYVQTLYPVLGQYLPS